MAPKLLRRPCKAKLRTGADCRVAAVPGFNYCRRHAGHEPLRIGGLVIEANGALTADGISIEAGVRDIDAQAKTVSTVIQKILDGLDLTDEQKARSRQVVIDILRENPEA